MSFCTRKKKDWELYFPAFMWSNAKIRSSDHTLSLKAVASFHAQTKKPKLLFFHFPYRTFIKLNGFFRFLLVCSTFLCCFSSRARRHTSRTLTRPNWNRYSMRRWTIRTRVMQTIKVKPSRWVRWLHHLCFYCWDKFYSLISSNYLRMLRRRTWNTTNATV